MSLERDRLAKGEVAATVKPRRVRRKQANTLGCVLIPLGEVEAIRSLSIGMVYPRCGVTIESRESGALGGACRGWRKRVPRSEIAAAGAGESFGKTVLFEVELPEADCGSDTGDVCTVRVPFSIARVRRMLFEATGARDELRARVSSFPDVPLNAVPLAVERSAFGGADAELALPLAGEVAENPQKPYRPDGQAQMFDKCLGVLAGLMHALRRCSLDGGELDSLAACLALPMEGQDLPVQLVGCVARELELNSGEYLGPAFVTEMARRFCALTSREGFEPEAMLREIACVVGTDADEKDVRALRTFEAKAIRVLDGMDPDANVLLADEGSIGLRASLAVLRIVGDVGQLEAMSQRPDGIGQRVGAVAWALVGALKGCASLPTSVKAEPEELLKGLGDASEHLRDRRRGLWSGKIVRRDSGRRVWETYLGGRRVGTLELSEQECYREIFPLAERNGWCCVDGLADLSYRLPESATPPIVIGVRCVDMAPIVPQRAAVRISVSATPRASKSGPSTKSLHEMMARAQASGVILEIAEDARGRIAQFVLYLPCDAGIASHLLDATERIRAVLSRKSITSNAVIDAGE